MTISYNSNYNETLPMSDTCIQFGLGSNVEQTYTVPGNDTQQYQAFFSYNQVANVFVGLNATPVVPASGTVGTQQFNEFRPEKRYVRGGDVLHLITPDATAYAGVSLRALQS